VMAPHGTFYAVSYVEILSSVSFWREDILVFNETKRKLSLAPKLQTNLNFALLMGGAACTKSRSILPYTIWSAELKASTMVLVSPVVANPEVCCLRRMTSPSTELHHKCLRGRVDFLCW
jgi:hypothetical protein